MTTDQRYANDLAKLLAGPPKDSVPLACPECGDTTSLATLERLTGECGLIGVIRTPDGRVSVDHGGRTDIDWDSSKTIGVTCRTCGWTYKGDDWRARLVPEGEPGVLRLVAGERFRVGGDGEEYVVAYLELNGRTVSSGINMTPADLESAQAALVGSRCDGAS